MADTVCPIRRSLNSRAPLDAARGGGPLPGLPASTVHRILTRHGLRRLA